MRTWFITCPAQKSCDSSYLEIWLSKDSSEDQGRKYEVNVSLGKPIDILSLKLNMIEDFNTQVSHAKSTRMSLFKSGKMEKVDKCPICGLSSTNSKFRLNIYGGKYHQCTICSHYFIINRPTKATLENFYLSDIPYASTYTNQRISETRIRQVAIPKAKWMIEQYESIYGQKPESVLDIGAGGGHFVYACKQLGMDAQGTELSTASREFCKKNFGFDLKAVDITKDWRTFSHVDVVTFWGLIEHVPNPISLLNAAYRLLSGKKSLVIVEVPRWDSMSTAIQSLFPKSVVRHLDPLGHINCFTDSSLSTAFELSGFAPVATWYFGMDAYELVIQLSYLLEDIRILKNVGKKIPSLQSAIDQGKLSDEIVLAGKPIKPVPIKNSV